MGEAQATLPLAVGSFVNGYPTVILELLLARSKVHCEKKSLSRGWRVTTCTAIQHNIYFVTEISILTGKRDDDL